MRRMILILVAALVAAPLVVSPAKASEKNDVITTVKQYIASFNNGDKNAWTATCTAPASIIDDFPPHAWQGATACADWWNDDVAFDKKNGFTDENLAVGEPQRLEINGDRAYVLMPATDTYKHNGKPLTDGALWTFALQKVSAGWRITGWAWSQGR